MKLLICLKKFSSSCVHFPTYNRNWKQFFVCNHFDITKTNLIYDWRNGFEEIDIDAPIYTCDFTGPHSNAHKNHVNNERNMLERFG